MNLHPFPAETIGFLWCLVKNCWFIDRIFQSQIHPHPLGIPLPPSISLARHGPGGFRENSGNIDQRWGFPHGKMVKPPKKLMGLDWFLREHAMKKWMITRGSPIEKLGILQIMSHENDLESTEFPKVAISVASKWRPKTFLERSWNRRDDLLRPSVHSVDHS